MICVAGHADGEAVVVDLPRSWRPPDAMPTGFAVDPAVEPLFGGDPAWSPAKERAYSESEVCPVCGSVGGRPLVVTLPDGELVQTGIRGADALVCMACQCVNPAHEQTIQRSRARRYRKPTMGERAARRRPPQGRRRRGLTVKERKAVLKVHGPIGAAWLALLEARRRKDHDPARELEALIAVAETTPDGEFRAELVRLAPAMARTLARVEAGLRAKRLPALALAHAG